MIVVSKSILVADSVQNVHSSYVTVTVLFYHFSLGNSLLMCVPIIIDLSAIRLAHNFCVRTIFLLMYIICHN